MLPIPRSTIGNELHSTCPRLPPAVGRSGARSSRRRAGRPWATRARRPPRGPPRRAAGAPGAATCVMRGSRRSRSVVVIASCLSRVWLYRKVLLQGHQIRRGYSIADAARNTSEATSTKSTRNRSAPVAAGAALLQQELLAALERVQPVELRGGSRAPGAAAADALRHLREGRWSQIPSHDNINTASNTFIRQYRVSSVFISIV